MTLEVSTRKYSASPVKLSLRMAPWRLFSGNLQRLFFWKPPAPFFLGTSSAFFLVVRGRLEKRRWRFPEKRRWRFPEKKGAGGFQKKGARVPPYTTVIRNNLRFLQNFRDRLKLQKMQIPYYVRWNLHHRCFVATPYPKCERGADTLILVYVMGAFHFDPNCHESPRINQF